MVAIDQRKFIIQNNKKTVKLRMNDQTIIDIQKHNNKINRILNKISERYPHLTEQIDLALYSSLKIQKIVKKYIDHNNLHPKLDKKQQNKNQNFSSSLTDDDQLYQNALNLIESFKSATKKLQNKVGILLRQQEINRKIQKAKYHNQLETYYQAPQTQFYSKNATVKGKRKIIENKSPFSPHIVQFSQNKPKKKQFVSSDSKNKNLTNRERKKFQEYVNDSQSFEQANEADDSKNISELDQEIIELASEIKHIIKRR